MAIAQTARLRACMTGWKVSGLLDGVESRGAYVVLAALPSGCWHLPDRGLTVSRFRRTRLQRTKAVNKIKECQYRESRKSGHFWASPQNARRYASARVAPPLNCQVLENRRRHRTTDIQSNSLALQVRKKKHPDIVSPSHDAPQ